MTETKETIEKASAQEAKVEKKTSINTSISASAGASAGGELVAAVLIRGLIGTRSGVRETLAQLRLRKKHTCVVMKKTPIVRGMLQKAKDFIAYGQVSPETLAALKKARTPTFADEKKGMFVFNLTPPRGGFARGGIKKTTAQGGALGYHKGGMDALLKKMM